MDMLSYDFNVTDIVFSCRVPPENVRTIHRNRPSHGVAFHTEGLKTYRFSDGTVLTTGVNDLIFLPEGSDYDVEINTPGDCWAINFKVTESIHLPPFACHIKNAAKLRGLFNGAEKAYGGKQPGYRMRCRGIVYEILLTVADENRQTYLSGRQKQLIAPALEYIHQSYTETELPVPELAARCRISEAYFRRLFGACYGVSPVAYLNRLKLERAKELLAQSGCSVETVAALSGFQNTSYFCRYFKRTVGMTPLAYRRENAAP